MMKKTWQIVLVAVLAVAALTWLLLPTSDDPASADSDAVLRSRRIREEARKRRQEMRQERLRVAGNGVPRREDGKAEKAKPAIEISEEEKESLDELQKKILEDICTALDNDDFNAIQRAVARMRRMGMERARKAGSKDWTSFVSRALRSAAISALGWAGGDALPELAEFLADPDPELAQEAMDQFELSMQDFSLGDYAKAEIIKSVCSVITDEDMVDWMMMEAINARNSVGLSTLAYIAQNGTEAAKAKIPEYLEFFTGEEITTIEQAEQWYAENPDDPSVDDDLYGPISE